MTDEIIKKHLDYGQTWDTEIYHNLLQRQKVAWIVASIAATIALCEAIAIMVMAPMKESVPYVITVDKQSGYLEAVQRLGDTPLSQQQAITNYNLANYIQLRESYLYELATTNFKKIQVMSVDSARNEHLTLWEKDNSENPSSIYGAKGIIDIKVLSVTPLNKRTASVRFIREVKHQNTISESTYTAIVIYEYRHNEQSNKARMINPLGFTVTSYHLTEEFNQKPE